MSMMEPKECENCGLIWPSFIRWYNHQCRGFKVTKQEEEQVNIKKPVWPPHRPQFYTSLVSMGYSPKLPESVITLNDFNDWYAEHIESLGPAVEVYGSHMHGFKNELWAMSQELGEEETHSALLIGVRPLKEETAEDLLAELLQSEDSAGIVSLAASQRARKFLEKKGRKV